jgi:hypothetical protein
LASKPMLAVVLVSDAFFLAMGQIASGSLLKVKIATVL